MRFLTSPFSSFARVGFSAVLLVGCAAQQSTPNRTVPPPVSSITPDGPVTCGSRYPGGGRAHDAVVVRPCPVHLGGSPVTVTVEAGVPSQSVASSTYARDYGHLCNAHVFTVYQEGPVTWKITRGNEKGTCHAVFDGYDSDGYFVAEGLLLIKGGK